MWIGFNEKNIVQSGSWKWIKVCKKASKRKIEKEIKKSKKKDYFDDIDL